jgi:S1-C subfamily serine protease
MVRHALHRHFRRRLTGWAAASATAFALASPCLGQDPATIERVKASVVAVGSFDRLRQPQFTFSGTGFAVADGSLIATNAHIVHKLAEGNATLAIAQRTAQNATRVRPARLVRSDASADLALLKIDGQPLPTLVIGNSERVREGELYLFTGFPIGAVLGLSPVTHRAMIAAITPLVIPAGRANQLNAPAVRRLQTSPFSVFQLDGTAYPGNSGSPVYDPAGGEVIGIINSVFVKGTKESALTHPSGITYAIPVQQLKALLDRAP